MFYIEDEWHCELEPKAYASLKDAVDELKNKALLDWDKPPIVAPCSSWRTYGRQYAIIEYDDTVTPYVQKQRLYALEIDAKGQRWLTDFEYLYQ